MLLGKRPRRPVKRTTSMTEITVDLGVNGGQVLAPPSDPQSPFLSDHGRTQKQSLDGSDQRITTTVVSPRNSRRHSCDFQFEGAQFLKACSFCKRHLVPGRDIYMYRGDSAFCSPECRQHQMNQDERKEKCSLASKKEAASSPSVSVAPQAPSNGGTVAAL